MGVRFRDGAKCNGVLIHVDEEELMRFDVREAGYDRQKIDLADIHCHVDSDKLVDANLPLWPTSREEEVCSDGINSESSFREQLVDVRCSECRLLFQKAHEKRKMKNMNRAITQDDGSLKNEDIAVWVYVQSEK